MEVFLGTKESDGRPVSIYEKDRRKHMAIFGKSGVGKTTLMRNMVVADLNAGNGLTVVEPNVTVPYVYPSQVRTTARRFAPSTTRQASRSPIRTIR